MSLKTEFRKWVLSGGVLLLLLAGVVTWLLKDARRIDQPAASAQPAVATRDAGKLPPLLSETTNRPAGNPRNEPKPGNPSVPAPVGNLAAAAATPVDADEIARQQEERQRRLDEEKQKFPHRLRNTDQLIGELVHNENAVLLRNAFIDVNRLSDLKIPAALAGPAFPGAYVVHAPGGVTAQLREQLDSVNAHEVSYIPNNALLVTMSEQSVRSLAGSGLTILPYTPYYKLPDSLMAVVMDGKEMPTKLMTVTFFPGMEGAGRAEIARQGMIIRGEDKTPFGDQVILETAAIDLTSMVQIPSVLSVDPYYPRALANDLNRVALSVATNTVAATTNYLNLTGTNVMVGINDTGVDSTHPDLAGRVDANFPNALMDPDGHGTHVAGTIMSSGLNSPGITNNIGSVSNASFRGIAPEAKLFSQTIDRLAGPIVSDQFLQEEAALEKVEISNNSWGYRGLNEYNFASASYDAAVRDSLPGVTGDQFVTYVFAAGNDGNGTANGLAGDAGSISAPGTAKNVITVGALESFRNLTNKVVVTNSTSGQVTTNTPFLGPTDSTNQVVYFSSRGNVGIGIEGEFGRFKPDVVAPGSFTISTRSSSWVDPEGFGNVIPNYQTGLQVPANSTNFNNLFIPSNVDRVRIVLRPNDRSPNPFPSMQISAGPLNSMPSPQGMGDVTFAVSAGIWVYGVENPSAQVVDYDAYIFYFLKDNPGDYFQVLAEMNDALAPYYRFESGTSMAAPAVSGFLALIEEYWRDCCGIPIRWSPDMMKAMLINSSRTVNRIYGYSTRDFLNLQGWGQPNLTNAIPKTVVENIDDKNKWSAFFATAIEAGNQQPGASHGLATGESITRKVTLNQDAAFSQLRVTLVWTDPPGNPVAAVKLVNNLDLIVTNLDTGEVYLGNNFTPESTFVEPGTNILADAVNNVENVFINRPLGSNYTVTVRAARVNVNAITGPDASSQPIGSQLNTEQDFALVISLGDSSLGGAMNVTELSVPSTGPVTQAPVVPVPVVNLANGVPLQFQRVAANPPYLTTTNGAASQWNFYVYTNVVGLTNSSYTNFAVATFLPPNLGHPRTMGQGDLDLYLSRDPGLTNLVPGAIADALKSVRRGGTESIQFSDALPGEVYYLGVKSEDQQAVEFGIIAAVSNEPFTDCVDGVGCTLRPIYPADRGIPDGTPDSPQYIPLIFPGPTELIDVRRVLVTNSFWHQSPGDLLGDFSHGVTDFAVLENHRWPNDGLPLDALRSFLYDDSGEQFDTLVPGLERIPTDGPGSLRSFTGKDGQGPWNYFLIDNSPNFTGQVDAVTVFLEAMPNLEDFALNLLPGEAYIVSTNVLPGATNLTVYVSNLTANIAVYIKRDQVPTPADYDKYALMSPPSGQLSITPRDVPPLSPGLYHILFYNPPSSAPISARGRIEVGYDLANTGAKNYTLDDDRPLIDDARTNSVITVTNFQQVADIEVGFRIEHERAADLSVYLTSPQGTRVLLAENRGRTNTLGYGEGGPNTETLKQRYLEGFENYRRGAYTNGELFGPWTVLSEKVSVEFAPERAWAGVRLLSLGGGGAVSNSLETVVNSLYDLVYAYRFPQVPAARPVSLYALEGNGQDVAGFNEGTVVGDPTFGPGVVRDGMNADGTDDYVFIPASTSLNIGLGTGVTINAWINPTGVSNSMPIMEWNAGANNPGTDNGVGVSFLVTAGTGNGELTANLVADDGTPHLIVAPPGSVLPGVYQHVAVTYDKASGNAVLYVNGVAVANQNLGTFTPQTSTDAYLGYRPFGANAGIRWTGGLDEVGIYAFALSACDVQAIYSAGATGLNGADFAACGGGGGVQVSVNNAVADVQATSMDWQFGRIRFQATATTTPLAFLGLGQGVNLDEIVLAEVITNAPIVYTRFTENTNLALLPIKFATPPYATNTVRVLLQETGFETAGAGDYPAIAPVENDWTVVTNSSAVIYDPVLSADDNYFLALADGQLALTNFPVTVGGEYNITFKYRDNGILSWWPGDNSSLDVNEINNGLFVQPLYGPGKVREAFRFTGTDPRRVTFGDPDAMNLARSFSIEGWINLSAYPAGQAPILVRADDAGNVPYMLGVRNDQSLVFQINALTNGMSLASGSIPTNTWVHVGATFDDQDGKMVLYVDGVNVAQTNITFLAASNLDPADNPQVTIGGHPNPSLNAFNGSIDELTVYYRALSESEIGAVYRADSNGKSGANELPHPESTAYLAINSLETNVFVGSPIWNEVTYSLTAKSNALDLVFTGNAQGMLLDQIQITESISFNHFLTEDLLKPFIGENAGGEWSLTVWDNRRGAAVDARLISWTLDMVYANTNATCIPLKHAVLVTNTIPANSWQYYCVEVPLSASFATNFLTTSIPANMWFSQSGLPDGTYPGDYLFLNGSLDSQATLGTNGLAGIQDGAPFGLVTDPKLVPGQRYYLGVENVNGVTMDVVIGVEFDLIDGITRATNGVAINRVIQPGQELEYFQIDVSSNAIAVAFEIINADGDVDLLVQQGPTLPGTNRFDFAAGLPNNSIADKLVLVDTNTTPAIAQGRWYAAAWNKETNSVSFQMRITEIYGYDPATISTNVATIVTLTNGVAFDGIQPAGVSLTNFYCFTITNSASAVLFEVYGQDEDVDLLVTRDLLPSIVQYDYISERDLLRPEQVVVRTNALIPDLNGNWYIGVPNNGTVPANFTVRAVVATGGILPGGQPPTIFDLTVVPVSGPTNQIQFSFTTIVGENYEVQSTPNLNTPIVWSVLTTINASGPEETYLDPTPISPPPPGMRYYRIQQVP